jgi:hypothetical protein
LYTTNTSMPSLSIDASVIRPFSLSRSELTQGGRFARGERERVSFANGPKRGSEER